MLSYVGAIIWLYEKPRAGRLALILVALFALGGAWLTANEKPGDVAITSAATPFPAAARWLAHLPMVTRSYS